MRVPGRATGDPRYRWAILGVGCLAQAVVGALVVSTGALSPIIQAAFSFSLGWMALVLAAFQAGLTLTLLLWGLIADRVGERVVIGAGMTGATGALVAAAYARSGPMFVLMMAASGMCAASVSAASGRAVMAWFAPSERGLALGIRQTSAMVGQALAAATLPVVATSSGLDSAFVALGSASAVAALAALYWLRDPTGPVPDAAAASPAVGPLRDRRVWQICIGSGVLVFPQIALIGFVVLFLHHERGFSAGAAAGVLSAMTLGGAVGRLCFGYWSDRLGSRLVPLRRVALALAGALAVAVVLLDAPAAVLILTLVVVGSLAMGWNGLSFAAVAELGGRERSGAALGLQQTALGVMGVVTPVVFAAAVGAVDWRGAFALLILCPVLSYPFFRLDRAGRSYPASTTGGF